MVGSEDAPEGASLYVSMDIDLRAFRFSRQGPKGDGKQLAQPNRRKIATAMTTTGDPMEGEIPAAFTYLGQFVDHDLTFDKSRLRDDVTVPVTDLVQGRSPSLDLDSLYGLGPDMTPEFYAADKAHLLTGTTSAVGAQRRLLRERQPGLRPAAHLRHRPEHADPRRAQRPEPGRRPDPPRVHPLPQPGG